MIRGAVAVLLLGGAVVDGTISNAGAEGGCGEYSFGFTNTRLINDGISESAGPFPISLPAGTYDVTLVGRDEHSSRPYSDQPGERWYVDMNNGWQSPLTEDLPDDLDMMTTSLPAQTVPASTAISVHHAGEGNVNSIEVVCVGFTTVGVVADDAEAEAPADAPSDDLSGDESTEDGEAETEDGEAETEDNGAEEASDDTESEAAPADEDAPQDDAETVAPEDEPVEDESAQDEPVVDGEVEDEPVEDEPVEDEPVVDDEAKDDPAADVIVGEIEDGPAPTEPVGDPAGETIDAVEDAAVAEPVTVKPLEESDEAEEGDAMPEDPRALRVRLMSLHRV